MFPDHCVTTGVILCLYLITSTTGQTFNATEESQYCTVSNKTGKGNVLQCNYQTYTSNSEINEVISAPQEENGTNIQYIEITKLTVKRLIINSARMHKKNIFSFYECHFSTIESESLNNSLTLNISNTSVDNITGFYDQIELHKSNIVGHLHPSGTLVELDILSSSVDSLRVSLTGGKSTFRGSTINAIRYLKSDGNSKFNIENTKVEMIEKMVISSSKDTFIINSTINWIDVYGITVTNNGTLHAKTSQNWKLKSNSIILQKGGSFVFYENIGRIREKIYQMKSIKGPDFPPLRYINNFVVPCSIVVPVIVTFVVTFSCGLLLALGYVICSSKLRSARLRRAKDNEYVKEPETSIRKSEIIEDLYVEVVNTPMPKSPIRFRPIMNYGKPENENEEEVYVGYQPQPTHLPQNNPNYIEEVCETSMQYGPSQNSVMQHEAEDNEIYVCDPQFAQFQQNDAVDYNKRNDESQPNIQYGSEQDSEEIYGYNPQNNQMQQNHNLNHPVPQHYYGHAHPNHQIQQNHNLHYPMPQHNYGQEPQNHQIQQNHNLHYPVHQHNYGHEPQNHQMQQNHNLHYPVPQNNYGHEPQNSQIQHNNFNYPVPQDYDEEMYEVEMDYDQNDTKVCGALQFHEEEHYV